MCLLVPKTDGNAVCTFKIARKRDLSIASNFKCKIKIIQVKVGDKISFRIEKLEKITDFCVQYVKKCYARLPI